MAAARLAALVSVRVVSSTKNPCCANFCAIAPPTPHRAPTGMLLSSSALPCASFVLRPSDCHLEVAPTTTATGLPLVFLMSGSPFPAPPGTQRVAHDQSLVLFTEPWEFLGEHRHALSPGARHLGDV